MCLSDVHLKTHSIEDIKLLELYKRLTGAKVCMLLYRQLNNYLIRFILFIKGLPKGDVFTNKNYKVFRYLEYLNLGLDDVVYSIHQYSSLL